jgi:hypothetical protein
MRRASHHKPGARLRRRELGQPRREQRHRDGHLRIRRGRAGCGGADQDEPAGGRRGHHQQHRDRRSRRARVEPHSSAVHSHQPAPRSAGVILVATGVTTQRSLRICEHRRVRARRPPGSAPSSSSGCRRRSSGSHRRECEPRRLPAVRGARPFADIGRTSAPVRD